MSEHQDAAAAGTLYCVSAPSGAGKTSLVKALIEDLEDVQVSVSHTTRAPRPGEQDGVDYNFVSAQVFESMVAEGQFLEYARVFDNSYGTSRRWVEQRLTSGTDVILEIDWQGARTVRAAFPDCVGVFVLPPSRAALQARLDARGQDSAEVIGQRMAQAVAEMMHYHEYDYVVINDDFSLALWQLRAIFVAQRQRLAVQRVRQAALLAELLE